MIRDFANSVRKNKKLQKAVIDYFLTRDKDYMDSKCRSRMEKRYTWLKSSLDGNYSPSKSEGYTSNGWLPSLIFPMVREMYYMGRAMTMKNFRQDPLWTLTPMYDTPFSNSIMAQIALNTNAKTTRFRSKCFSTIVDDVWRCGLAVTSSSIFKTTSQMLKTVDTGFGIEQRPMSMQGRTNVINQRIHPLNYAQDPMVVDPEDSSWKRIIDTVSVARLITLYKQTPQLFIQENIEKLIKIAKNEVWEDTDKFKDDETILPDLARNNVDIKKFYGKVWISGNEDDETDYIVMIVEDIIISVIPNTFDDSICPINTLRLRRRPEYYWGNTPIEDHLSHEKFMHIIMNMTAQNALQALERYIFYDMDAFDISDIYNSRTNGGFVPIQMKSGLQVQNMIHEHQGRDISVNNIDWVVRELKESSQKSAFKPDFLRSGNKGGLANNTATAASILDETSNILESDVMETLGYDVANLGRINTVMLQMFLGDIIKLPVIPKEKPMAMMKSMILGDFDYEVVSTIHKNRIQEMVRLQNVLTQMMNYIGTAHPTWQNVNLMPIAKKWIQTLDVGDPDSILPEQIPQIPQPGMGGTGMGLPALPSPQQQPMIEAAPQEQGAIYA